MSLETNKQPPPRQEIVDWLIRWIAKELGMPANEIDPGHSLLQYSMSSLTATILVGDLEDWLNLRLPASLVWDYPSIDAMTDYIVEKVTSKQIQDVAGDAGPGTKLASDPTKNERQLLEDIDKLSDQDIDALLKRFA